MENIKNAIKDKLLTERCNEFASYMLKNGMELNKICMFVKDYQRKYLFIKQEGGNYNAFTVEMWWKLGQKGNGKFALAF